MPVSSPSAFACSGSVPAPKHDRHDDTPEPQREASTPELAVGQDRDCRTSARGPLLPNIRRRGRECPRHENMVGNLRTAGMMVSRQRRREIPGVLRLIEEGDALYRAVTAFGRSRTVSVHYAVEVVTVLGNYKKY